MKKIKSLILFFIIILTCSFTNNERAVKTFTVDFKQSLTTLNMDDVTTYQFNYGQKFVLAYGTYSMRKKWEQLTVVPTIEGNDYVTVNSKSDLPKICEVSDKYWNLPTDAVSYVMLPIGDYLLTDTCVFGETLELTDFYMDIETNGPYEFEIRDFINNHYNGKIMLSATDDGPTIDNMKPVINNYNGMFITNVNDPITKEEVKSHLKAIDDVDGDITSKIKIDQDGYTDNRNKPGDYNIKFSVSDNSNNTAYLTVTVRVVDTDRPLFNGPSEMVSPLSSPLTIEAIKSAITVTDNVDGALTPSVNDKFTEHKGVVGDYDVIFTATDSSGNSAIKKVVVHVKDDIKPTISAGATSVVTSIHNKITIDQIKSKLQVSDNVDDTLTANSIVVVSDGYTSHYNKLGSYEIVLAVTDKYGNRSENFVFTVKVEDKQIPQFYVDEFIINCDPKTKLERADILNILNDCETINFDNISDSEKQIVVTYDGYNNSLEEGKYKMSLKVSYDDGYVQNLDLIINKEINKPVSLPWYTRTYYYISHYSMIVNGYISAFFDKIYSFFYNLFH